MVRFLSWVAAFSVIFAIVRIILMEQTDPGKKTAMKAGENAAVKKAEQPPAGVTLGAIPYAKRPRLLLFSGRGWNEESSELASSVLASPQWGFLARHQAVFQEIDMPRDPASASPRLRSLIEKHGIGSVPTLVVLSPDGTELGRRSGGESNPDSYVKWIRERAEIRFRPIVFAETGSQAGTDPARTEARK